MNVVFTTLPYEYEIKYVCGKEPHELSVGGRHPVLAVDAGARRGSGFPDGVLQHHVHSLVHQGANEECDLKIKQMSIVVVNGQAK